MRKTLTLFAAFALALSASAEEPMVVTAVGTAGFTGEKTCVYTGWAVGVLSNVQSRVTVKTEAMDRDGNCSFKVLLDVNGRGTTYYGKVNAETGLILGRDSYELSALKFGADEIGGAIFGWGAVHAMRDPIACGDAEGNVLSEAFKGRVYAVSVLDDCNELSFVTVRFLARGVAKLQLRLPDGSTANTVSSLVVGAGEVVLPVLFRSGREVVSLLLAFDRKTCAFAGADALGEVRVGGGKKRVWTAAEGAETVSLTAERRTIGMDVGTLLRRMPKAMTEYLPTNLTVAVGQKWRVEAKAGKVVCDRKTGELRATTENPSGLTLSYDAHKGTIKGVFTVYEARPGVEPKARKATVCGLWVGDAGVAMATVKGVGSWLMSVE